MEFRIAGQTVQVNVPTWTVLEARVTERLALNKGFALATINLDHLVKLRSSHEFRNAYEAHDLIVADGNPIVWMARLAGRPVSLVPGADAILPLCRIAASQGVGVALVGSTPAALAGAKSALEREVRDLHVVCTIAPPMGFNPTGQEALDLLRQVEASGARLCFVALGAPRQERLAAIGRRITPTIGFAGIGAGLDFCAGTQRRAPHWARRYAIEWLWRGLSSPRRLGVRYIRCVAILPGQLLRAMMLRLRTGRI